MSRKISPAPYNLSVTGNQSGDSLRTIRIDSGVKVNADSQNQESNFCAGEENFGFEQEGDHQRPYTKTPVAELFRTRTGEGETSGSEGSEGEKDDKSIDPLFQIVPALSLSPSGDHQDFVVRKSFLNELEATDSVVQKQESVTREPIVKFLPRQSEKIDFGSVSASTDDLVQQRQKQVSESAIHHAYQISHSEPKILNSAIKPNTSQNQRHITRSSLVRFQSDSQSSLRAKTNFEHSVTNATEVREPVVKLVLVGEKMSTGRQVNESRKTEAGIEKENRRTSKDSIEMTPLGSYYQPDLPVVSINDDISTSSRISQPMTFDPVVKTTSNTSAKADENLNLPRAEDAGNSLVRLRIAEHLHSNTVDDGWTGNDQNISTIPKKADDKDSKESSSFLALKLAEQRYFSNVDDDWNTVNNTVESRSNTKDTWETSIGQIEKLKKDDTWTFSIDKLTVQNKADDWKVNIDDRLDRGSNDNWSWSLKSVERRSKHKDTWQTHFPTVKGSNKDDWSSDLKSVKHKPQKDNEWKFSLKSLRSKSKKDKEWTFSLHSKFSNPAKDKHWSSDIRNLKSSSGKEKWSYNIDRITCSKKDQWNTDIREIKRTPENDDDWKFENNVISSGLSDEAKESSWEFDLKDVKLDRVANDDWKTDFRQIKIAGNGANDEKDWTFTNNPVRYEHEASDWSSSIRDLKKSGDSSKDWSSKISRVGKRNDELSWSSSLKDVKCDSKKSKWTTSIGVVSSGKHRDDEWTFSNPRVATTDSDGGCTIL